MTKPTGKRGEEAGFALLLVYVLAAAIAITLYMEVPRIAFESQRDREQRTIDHALQYQRAIQLFYRKYHLYPQTLDDLETTRNIRFLRRRYLDPLTGKEFRLLHVGPTGQLTDSLVTPLTPPGTANGNGQSSGFGSGSAFGSSSTSASNLSTANQSANASQSSDPNNPNTEAPDPLNMAARRPSDRIPGKLGPGETASTDPNGEPPSDPDQTAQPAQPVQPGQLVLPGQPGLPGQPVQPGQPGLPGQPVQQPTDPNQPSLPGQPQDPSQQPQPPVQQPQFPTQQYPGQAPGSTPSSSFQYPQTISSQGATAPTSGAPANGASGQANSAASMIQQLLTTPRQPPSSAASAFTTGNTGGIAGVASTAPGKGIHLVNDHAKYKEWEFVYDLKKDKTVVGAAGVNAQQQMQQQMQQPGALSNGNSPFGSSPFSSNSSGSSSTPSSSTTTAAPTAPTTPPPQQ
ncbi:MAG TPA: hypothetical protein VME17_09970 [Bryobacteraceae bacterium]|nr:hypothetical protein [Bryobacteraceae bacterium]